MPVPPSVTPPPGNPRFPHFDGLRAIAALSVLSFHVLFTTGYLHGWEGAFGLQLAAGVPVFFVISGFLLYRPFVAARVGGAPPVGTLAFARRRLLRIVPGYWFALIALALWPGLQRVFSGDWWVYFGFTQAFRHGMIFEGLPQAWSLGTEVTFYAALPLYAALLARLFLRGGSARVRTELTILTVLAAGTFLFRLTVPRPQRVLTHTILGTFDWFALGMALALLSVVALQRAEKPRAVRLVEEHASLCWVASLGLVAAGTIYVYTVRQYHPYLADPLHFIWAAAAVCLVLPAVFPGTGAGLPQRLLAHRLVAWLGAISYGIFLWHLPLLPEVTRLVHRGFGIETGNALGTLVVFAFALVATVACAAFSFYVVERPALRLKERRARGPREPAAFASSSAPVPAE